jgi:hypothetical protein
VEEVQRPVFIKPTNRAQPTERKSLLGLDRLAAAKRAENFLKQQMEEEESGNGTNGAAAQSLDDFEADASSSAPVRPTLPDCRALPPCFGHSLRKAIFLSLCLVFYRSSSGRTVNGVSRTRRRTRVV